MIKKHKSGTKSVLFVPQDNVNKNNQIVIYIRGKL